MTTGSQYSSCVIFFFFNDTATTEIYTLSLHDALPIWPEDGVVNAFGQAHDVPNVFVSDASQFTTGAAANPTLTIVALAIRQAEYIAEQLRTQAIPTGRAAWDGRDPGGSVSAAPVPAAQS